MKPYYEHNGITIYHGDCRDVLPLLGTAVADVVIADPPYGDTSLAWDRWIPGWLGAVRPVLKGHGSLWCFGSMRMLLGHATEFNDGWHLAQEIVWEKHNGSGFHNDRFKRVHELAVQFYPKSVAWGDLHKEPVFTHDATARTMRRKKSPPHMGMTAGAYYHSDDGGPRLMRSVQYVPSCQGSAMHPTQKPLGILWPLIAYSCPRGGTVLDPTCGSGSTLEAARQQGCLAIGIEAQERYCEISAQRLSQGVLEVMA